MAKKTKVKPKRGLAERKMRRRVEEITKDIRCRFLPLPPEWGGYEPGLPFVIHAAEGFVPPTPQGFVERDYEWDNRVCAVAQEALRRGYAISFPVSEAWIAQATALVSQNLLEPVRARYDTKAHRLIIWSREPMDDPYGVSAYERQGC